MTMMSACWGWLAPELANFTQVLSYDRAGLGWSEERDGLRDGEQIAFELSALLEVLSVKGPVVLIGHSMGALFQWGFLRERKGLAQAMIWLDPAHPDQMKRREIRRRVRNLIFYIEAARLLAAKNVPAIELPLTRHLQGLPPEKFQTLRRFFRNPGHLRSSAREARAWDATVENLHSVSLREIPLLVISAERNAMPGWGELQKDLPSLSRNSRHVTFPDMSHISMIANRAHAVRVAEEIRGFLTPLSL